MMVANNPNIRQLYICLSLPADAVVPDQALDADTVFNDVPLGLEHIRLHGNVSSLAVPVVNLWRSAPTFEFAQCHLLQIVSVFEAHGLMEDKWIVRIHPDAIPKRDEYREQLRTGKITDIADHIANPISQPITGRISNKIKALKKAFDLTHHLHVSVGMDAPRRVYAKCMFRKCRMVITGERMRKAHMAKHAAKIAKENEESKQKPSKWYRVCVCGHVVRRDSSGHEVVHGRNVWDHTKDCTQTKRSPTVNQH